MILLFNNNYLKFKGVVMGKQILTPVSLWEGFDDSLPLKETTLNSYTLNGVKYSSIYFSARQTNVGRTRVFGLFAEPLSAPVGSLLIIPDVCDTIDTEIVTHFANLGYVVLSVDLRGEVEGVKNFTKYPSDVNYANYLKVGRTFNYVDETAFETCWYEWTSVCRYAVSFLKTKYQKLSVGVMGNKHGANVLWQLSATDKRVDASVFLFGAGWLSYKGNFKQNQTEIELDEERYRFIAGVDAHAYAPYVDCPVLYLSTTNSSEFDTERANDTLMRLKNQDKCWHNYVTSAKDILDYNCFKDVELFFAKFIKEEKVYFPQVPQISVDFDDVDIIYNVKCQQKNKIVSTYVYSSSDDVNPKDRIWYNVHKSTKHGENVDEYVRKVYGNRKFELCFATVKYENGLTLSSKFLCKKVDFNSTSSVPGVIFSSTKMPSNFIVEDIKTDVIANVFASEKLYKFDEGPFGIIGISTQNSLTSYLIRKLAPKITDESLIKFDVYTKFANEITLTLYLKNGESFTYTTSVSGGEIWQNVEISIDDFKNFDGLSIKNYEEIYSVTISSLGGFTVNNFVLV